MATESASGYCEYCKKQVRIEREKTNHILHCLLTAFTASLWLPVWLWVANHKQPWRCSVCGNVVNWEGNSSEQLSSVEQIRHTSELRECPYCKEKIKLDAVVCKHCRSKVEPEEIVLTPQTYFASKHDNSQSDKNVGYIVIALIILSVLIYKMM